MKSEWNISTKIYFSNDSSKGTDCECPHDRPHGVAIAFIVIVAWTVYCASRLKPSLHFLFSFIVWIKLLSRSKYNTG